MINLEKNMIANYKTIKKDDATFLSEGGKVAIDFPDIAFTVLAYRKYSHAIEYEIFKKVGSGPEAYETASQQLVECLENEEEYLRPVPFMTGFVKWDGCSEWSGINEQFCHFCDGESLMNIGKVLHECWNLTAKLLEHWD